MNTIEVAIGLGSNLQEPRQQIQRALVALEHIAAGEVKSSSLYSTPPMGPQDQPDYINAVALFETAMAPLELLDAMQQIEQEQGRERRRHWGERTLDLDLLLYGREQISHSRLEVPHPGIAQRAFVLVPLAEVRGEVLDIPGVGRVGELLLQCDSSEIVKLGSEQ